jgi:hypothetical protein
MRSLVRRVGGGTGPGAGRRSRRPCVGCDSWPLRAATAGRRPLNSTALQSVDPVYRAAIARDARFTGKSGVSIWATLSEIIEGELAAHCGVLILCAEHATSLGHAQIGNTTFRSSACRRLAGLAVQLILGPMPERCSRAHRRAPLLGVYTLAWSDDVHLDEVCVSDRHSYRALPPDRQELPCRSLIRCVVTIDGAFARGRALSAAGIDLN